MDKQELTSDLKSKLFKLLPILIKNNNPENARDSQFCSQGKDTIIKIVTLSEREIFSAPIKILLGEKIIVERYSEEFVQNKVVEYYHKILKDNSKVNEYIEELLDFFLKEGINDYFVISRVENIRVNADQEYTLIDSTIKIMSESDLPMKKEDYTLLEAGKTEIIGKPAIFTIVKAGESEKAKELALHNFMVSFNLLRLYAPNFKPLLKGCVVSGTQELMVYNKTKGNLSHSLSRVGDLLLNHAYIDKKLYEHLISLGVGELNNPSSITKVVKECLYWFGLGLDEKHPSSRLLNFVTVLESTLKTKGEMTELKRAVSERGAILLYDKFEQRKEAMKQLGEIYNVRSKVVHTGVLLENKDLASLAGGYARAILMELIKKSKELNGNFDEFIISIDDIKLGKVNKDEKTHN